jgi:methylase of polypeptide subunit release factors
VSGRTDLGGRHHGIVQNVYPLPNDEEEQVRLDEQHFAMSCVMGGNVLVPLRRPRRILDVGTGSGNVPHVL